MPPSTGILDPFTGTENPLATNWTCPLWSGDANLKKASGVCNAEFTGASSSGYYDLAQFGPDCEAYCSVPTIGTGGDILALYLRMSSVGTATPDGYALVGVFGATDQLVVMRIDNGAGTEVGAYEAQELAAGDSVGISVIGSTFKMWYKPAAGAWSQVGSDRSDSAYSNAGYIGLRMNQSTAAVWSTDNFGGGDILTTAPSFPFKGGRW